MPTGHVAASIFEFAPAYHRDMNDLVITVSWEFFLGIMGTLIAIAYYANGRFTRLETNFDWLSDVLRELTIKAENISAKLFDNSSPVSLTATGRRSLDASGLKSYIDARSHGLISELRSATSFDLYDTQAAAFHLLGRIRLEDAFARRLKAFAFESGVSIDLMRRLGAIYLRDLALKRD